MRNQYRVDVVNNRSVPCGMNSIRYIGNNWPKAKAYFYRTDMCRDAWGKPNASYGVILSVWSDEKRDYIIKMEKGL